MISIIIPTYNNSDTIERALGSILRQTYVDYEVIVVDDKCTDDTMDKVRNYAQLLDTRLKIVSNKVNSGAGVSRQNGIKAAEGEFVFFLDSDDYLRPDCLQMMRMIQRQQDADIVYSPVHVEFPDNYSSIPFTQKMDEVYMTEGARLTLQVSDDQMKFVTGKLIRRKLFDKFEFSPKRVGEDVETLFKASYFAKDVRSTKYCGYVHVFRPGSVLSNKPLFYRYCINAEVTQSILDFLEDKNEGDIYDFFLARGVAYHRDMEKKMKTKVIPNKDIKEFSAYWQTVVDWYKAHAEAIEKVESMISKFVIHDEGPKDPNDPNYRQNKTAASAVDINTVVTRPISSLANVTD